MKPLRLGLIETHARAFLTLIILAIAGVIWIVLLTYNNTYKVLCGKWTKFPSAVSWKRKWISDAPYQLQLHANVFDREELKFYNVSIICDPEKLSDLGMANTYWYFL